MGHVRRLVPLVLASAFSLSAVALFAGSTGSITSGLVDALVSQLGVSKDQAAGGAGSILGFAKSNMKKDDFKKVTKAVPETNQLIKAAPKGDATTSAVSDLGSAVGGAAGTAGAAAGVAGTFSKLGLSSDMVGKFVPVITDYAKAKGGSTVGTLLGGALGALTK